MKALSDLLLFFATAICKNEKNYYIFRTEESKKRKFSMHRTRMNNRKKLPAFLAVVLLCIPLLCCLFSPPHAAPHGMDVPGVSARSCTLCHHHHGDAGTFYYKERDGNHLSMQEKQLKEPKGTGMPVWFIRFLPKSNDAEGEDASAVEAEYLPDRSVLFLWNRTLLC